MFNSALRAHEYWTVGLITEFVAPYGREIDLWWLTINVKHLADESSTETLRVLLLKVNFQYSDARRRKQGYMAPLS